jgi:hypothetical protein
MDIMASESINNFNDLAYGAFKHYNPSKHYRNDQHKSNDPVDH